MVELSTCRKATLTRNLKDETSRYYQLRKRRQQPTPSSLLGRTPAHLADLHTEAFPVFFD